MRPGRHTLLLISTAMGSTRPFMKNSTTTHPGHCAGRGIVRFPDVMEVNPSVPPRRFRVHRLRQGNPGKINMASGGNGTTMHVAGELFKMMTGVDMLHVPYRRAAPALIDLLGGQMQSCSTAMPSRSSTSGRQAAPLAVTTATRSKRCERPHVGDSVPGYEASAWYGLGAASKTPADIVERLNRESQCRPRRTEAEGAPRDMGGVLLGGSPADFGRLIADETAKWAKVVKFSGAKPD